MQAGWSNHEKKGASELAAKAHGNYMLTKDNILRGAAELAVAKVGAGEFVAGFQVDGIGALNFQAAPYGEGEATCVFAPCFVFNGEVDIAESIAGFAANVNHEAISQRQVQVVAGGDRNLVHVYLGVDAVCVVGFIACFIANIDVELMAHGAVGAAVQVEAAAHPPCVGVVIVANGVQAFNGVHGLHVIRSQSAGLRRGQYIRCGRGGPCKGAQQSDDGKTLFHNQFLF